MGMDMTRDLDQLYEFSDKTGATMELSYRPSFKTQLRLHLEHMDLHQSFAPGMFQMTANDKRFAANSYPSETDVRDNNRAFTLGSYRNEFIYSPDAIDLIPEAILNDLELDPAYVAASGIPQFDPNDAEKNREILKQMMEPWSNLNQDDRYSISGPDSFNSRKGNIITADWTQSVTDKVQFKIAVNHEDVERNSRSRAGYSNKRVISESEDYTLNGKTIKAWEPYIETYWRKIEGNTKATALKATLLYEFETDDSLFFPGLSKHKLLFGTDYDRLKKDPKEWHQLNGLNGDETGYFKDGDYYKEVFALNDGFGPEVSAIGYNGYDDKWEVAKDTKFDSETESAWFALQSEFLDGRLRSLAGLRHDSINIEFDSIDYHQKSIVKPKLLDKQERFTQVSPTIGALYWLNSKIGIFANYAESIQSPTGLDLDPIGRLIPPVTGEGYEYGLRFDLFDGKLNGQIAAFYIEKENDDIINYDWRLADIYNKTNFPQKEYAAYWNDSGVINNDGKSGSKVPGDISRAEGVECEFYYNPKRNISFVFSYTYNNLDAIKLAAKDYNPDFNEHFAQVWGQAPHNALLIGSYKFTTGVLKGFTIGANQSFRSSSSIGEWFISEDNANGDPIAGTGTWYKIKFDPEYVTSGFINYQKKLGNGRGVPVLNLGLRISNLFDNTDLINRNKGAFHRASRQYLLSANISF
jgi:hypothetical protein